MDKVFGRKKCYYNYHAGSANQVLGLTFMDVKDMFLIRYAGLDLAIFLLQAP
jgi:hypothetical protein